MCVLVCVAWWMCRGIPSLVDSRKWIIRRGEHGAGLYYFTIIILSFSPLLLHFSSVYLFCSVTVAERDKQEAQFTHRETDSGLKQYRMNHLWLLTVTTRSLADQITTKPAAAFSTAPNKTFFMYMVKYGDFDSNEAAVVPESFDCAQFVE